MKWQEKLIVFLSALMIFLYYKAFMAVLQMILCLCSVLEGKLYLISLGVCQCSIFSLRTATGNSTLRIPQALHAYVLEKVILIIKFLTVSHRNLLNI